MSDNVLSVFSWSDTTGLPSATCFDADSTPYVLLGLPYQVGVERDCMQSRIITEIGTILKNITISNGYSVNVANTSVRYDAVDHSNPSLRLNTDYPLIEFFLTDTAFTDLSNCNQEASATVNVLGYLKRDEDYDSTLPTRKEQHEFAADVRTAIFTSYDRQQSGDFSLTSFLLNREMKQEYFTMKKIAGVFTSFNVHYDIKFDER